MHIICITVEQNLELEGTFRVLFHGTPYSTYKSVLNMVRIDFPYTERVPYIGALIAFETLTSVIILH